MLSSLLKRKKLDNPLYTVAFYNLENLFDTIDDLNTLDGEFTPNGEKGWTDGRYKNKLHKLAKTISKIGLESSKKPPVLLGVAEVENEEVLKELISTTPLKKMDYGFVHYDSPDERGIDTSLIYDKEHFTVLFSEPISLLVYNLEGERDRTRDILYVRGKLNGELTHIFVNHWPSRRDGDTETDYKRIKAAQTIIDRMRLIEKEDSDPNYIVMGDFNDNPSSKSIQLLMEHKSLYNPMEKLQTPDRGSASYRKKWNLFDQIIFSHNFFNYQKQTHSFEQANIFNNRFLTEWAGKYKGSPFRTYVGDRYLGGYSDHFPVYIQLKLNL